ncbi:MAG: hypothetical protein JKY92_01520, partial [Magnetovibrio sp.]|nr:hypothetical protein [Magnetovibrio sp.]
TSAMRWVQGCFDDWNEKGKAEDKITVHTVWFAPWKYQNREDVWRGLIAEVMIACMEQTDDVGFLEEAKDLSVYLGKSLGAVISSLKIKVKGTTIDGDKLTKALASETEKYLCPEAAYLDIFETTFKTWVHKCLGENQRMVVFIDDLDRCLADIALQVLEALKLYLDIEGLAFVVGVDPDVINDQVGKRYKDLGLKKAKGQQYLAKMFQMEITLSPNEGQIKDFQAELLDENDVWNEVKSAEQKILSKVISNLAQGSPRETKRLVNSALIHGAGVKMSVLAHDENKDAPTTAQGIQVFLIRQVLERHFPARKTITARDEGTKFFRLWHDHSLEGKGGTLANEFLIKLRNVATTEHGIPTDGSIQNRKEFSEIANNTAEIINRFPHLFELLGDTNLAALIKIQYPAHGEELGQETDKDERLVHEAIAKNLDKTISQLTYEDFQDFNDLDLLDLNISSLEPVKKLVNLKHLRIAGTQVTDLTPLKNIPNLKNLDIRDTEIRDLRPLHHLEGLRKLWISPDQVSRRECIVLEKFLPNLKIREA